MQGILHLFLRGNSTTNAAKELEPLKNEVSRGMLGNMRMTSSYSAKYTRKYIQGTLKDTKKNLRKRNNAPTMINSS